MSRKPQQYPDLMKAGQLLAELADAFAAGTYEAIHKHHKVFERIKPHACAHCHGHTSDPLDELYAVLHRTREGVLCGKASRRDRLGLKPEPKA